MLGVFRTFLTVVIIGASSLQIAFYIETGAEIKWDAASNVPRDSAGIKLLLSGMIPAAFVALSIIIVARIVSGVLYNSTKALVSKLAETFWTPRLQSWLESKEQLYNEFPDEPWVLFSEADVNYQSIDPENLNTATYSGESRAQNLWRWLRRGLFLAPVVTVFILLAVRPRTYPYAHMSSTLPFTLLDAFRSRHSQNMCRGSSTPNSNPFPLPPVVYPEYWEQPNGKFPGWMPTRNGSMRQTDSQLPSWLPQERIPGFDRWYHNASSADSHSNRHHERHASYDPVNDPLHISNLDGDILAPITEAIKDAKVRIKHVVIISLESTRKDVFPLKKDSHLHKAIMNTHDTDESAAEANLQLANVSVNAEFLTGEDGGFDVEKKDNLTGSRTWRSLNKDKGGLNVQGAISGSSATFKSMLGSHCGVQPLPVDFTVEARGPIYQPCIPSILGLFNHNKQSPAKNGKRSEDGEDIKSRPWKSVLVQSITDQYDHQDDLNVRMGFSQTITKHTLVDPNSKHYPPTESDSNYFGLPERQVKPYLKDIFQSAKDANERLFLSHFTSSTHHPWNTPKSVGENINFMKKGNLRGERPLNRYLNTVKYGDRWIGEIMDMLDEFSMTEETLVVMVGDHGYTFDEESNLHSTFENGHISNLRVPLVFYHPSLPRIQLGINATSLSIIPTILDLLVETSSLNVPDVEIASNLIHQYEGQSLIRPFVTRKPGRNHWHRDNWNIAVLNAGGAFLSVSSAVVPFRLVFPICKSGVYRFTNTDKDPYELDPIEANNINDLANILRSDPEWVNRLSKEDDASDPRLAARWVVEALSVGKWWVIEQRRRWGFDGASLQDDRDPNDVDGMKKGKGRHWWQT
ncbi:hypothetical protein O988_04821 [Pseudogymnoascus sp. VKM F-3808]|nr:hypothetical protein O988_04821 [Pseudogymnoascus sp. VKM F-3808]